MKLDVLEQLHPLKGAAITDIFPFFYYFKNEETEEMTMPNGEVQRITSHWRKSMINSKQRNDNRKSQGWMTVQNKLAKAGATHVN